MRRLPVRVKRRAQAAYELTHGEQHARGAPEVFARVRELLLVSDERPPGGFAAAVADDAHAQGAHGRDGYDVAHRQEGGAVDEVRGREDGHAEELVLAVGERPGSRQRAGGARRAARPHQAQAEQRPLGGEELGVVPGEAELGELVGGGQRRGVEGAQLKEDQQEGAALAERPLAGAAPRQGQAVVRAERHDGEPEREVAQGEDDAHEPRLAPHALVESHHQQQQEVPAHRRHAGRHH